MDTKVFLNWLNSGKENLVVCPDCCNEGFVDIDTGGGRSRKQFCTCPRGQELAEKDEKARAGEGD